MNEGDSNPRITPANLLIGQVAAPFGIKGELKVNILTEFPDRFNKLEAVILAPTEDGPRSGDPTAMEDRRNADDTTLRQPFTRPRKPLWLNIETVRLHKGQALVKFAGVNDANDAEMLRSFFLMVPIEQALKLPRGTYYLYQLVGLDVYTTEGTLLGKLNEILSTGANDVYIVRGPGITDPTGELLIPAIKEIVKKIDVDGGRITVRPPSEWA
ncbi:MAG: ribosome maturation factor RimM [Chloroflexia bacterium]